MTSRRPSAVDEAERLFANAGLELPPIPDRFANALRAVENWCFATREISPMGMYLFDDYLIETLTGAAPDYLAFCHAGHGVNSYAINYHLVDGPLALFTQASWGGGYSNDREDAAALTAQFARCAALINAADTAKARGLGGPPGRLFVCESLLRGDVRWAWLDAPFDDETAARSWLHADSGQGLVKDGAFTGLEADLPTVAARQWLETAF